MMLVVLSVLAAKPAHAETFTVNSGLGSNVGSLDPGNHFSGGFSHRVPPATLSVHHAGESQEIFFGLADRRLGMMGPRPISGI